MEMTGERLTTEHEEPRVARALDQLRSLLVESEVIEAVAVQRRLFALGHRRSLVAATSGRFIAMRRGFFRDFYPQDIRWQDCKEARLRVGIFGADLTIVALDNPDLAVAGQSRVLKFAGLRKQEAQKVYRLCQANEQSWREKRRLRELEELRAKSGGIQLADGRGGAFAGVAGPTPDPTTRLQQAKEMFDKGLITDSEYETLKAKIISSV